MANMSMPSSLACAGVIAGEGQTLKQVSFPASLLLPVLVFMRFHGGRQGEAIYMSQHPLPATPLSLSLGFDRLGQGWDSSAVGKALVSAEAHTGLAHSLADGSCTAAIQVRIGVSAVLFSLSSLLV